MSGSDPASFRLAEAVDAWLRKHVPTSVHRVAYRVGFLALKPWWLVTRPQTNGVKVVVRRGDRVLLVRHAYTRRNMWDIPGGFVRAGEDPVVALRRELREELGIEPAAPPLHLGSAPARNDGKREILHAYAVDVAGEDVTPNTAELAEVRWVRRDELPQQTRRYARRVVARSYWELWDEEPAPAPGAVR
jgi:ADP-ribose pyrophosphatase YjhB (NUDIX family)